MRGPTTHSPGTGEGFNSRPKKRERIVCPSLSPNRLQCTLPPTQDPRPDPTLVEAEGYQRRRRLISPRNFLFLTKSGGLTGDVRERRPLGTPSSRPPIFHLCSGPETCLRPHTATYLLGRKGKGVSQDLHPSRDHKVPRLTFVGVPGGWTPPYLQ